MAGGSGLDGLSMADLRAERMRARRTAELARLRSRQSGDGAADDLAGLDATVRVLTDELISRYAADLSLVDSLLDPAYPAGGTTVGRAAG